MMKMLKVDTEDLEKMDGSRFELLKQKIERTNTKKKKKLIDI